jgi:hypothetical protein
MIDKTVGCGNINSIEITRDKVMKVEIVENKKLGLFEVVIDGVNFGVFEDSQSEQYAFFRAVKIDLRVTISLLLAMN